ncbi:FH6 [Scenedesmus sp. PABB004]|nr:FH6 [Scenedesmus sp. PABB004]
MSRAVSQAALTKARAVCDAIARLGPSLADAPALTATGGGAGLLLQREVSACLLTALKCAAAGAPLAAAEAGRLQQLRVLASGCLAVVRAGCAIGDAVAHAQPAAAAAAGGQLAYEPPALWAVLAARGLAVLAQLLGKALAAQPAVGAGAPVVSGEPGELVLLAAAAAVLAALSNTAPLGPRLRALGPLPADPSRTVLERLLAQQDQLCTAAEELAAQLDDDVQADAAACVSILQERGPVLAVQAPELCGAVCAALPLRACSNNRAAQRWPAPTASWRRRACQAAAWRAHKPVCRALAAAAGGAHGRRRPQVEDVTPTKVESLVGAEVTAVSTSDNVYHFTLQFAPPYVGGRGRAWVLGAWTNDLRREWLEAILNARLPASQQLWTNPQRSPAPAGGAGRSPPGTPPNGLAQLLHPATAAAAAAAAGAGPGSAAAAAALMMGAPCSEPASAAVAAGLAVAAAADAAAASGGALRRSETGGTLAGSECSARSGSGVSPDLAFAAAQPHQQGLGAPPHRQQHQRSVSDFSDAASLASGRGSGGGGGGGGSGGAAASPAAGGGQPAAGLAAGSPPSFSRTPSSSRSAWGMVRGLVGAVASMAMGPQQPPDWDARSHASDLSYTGQAMPALPPPAEAQPLGPNQEPLLVLLAALQGEQQGPGRPATPPAAAGSGAPRRRGGGGGGGGEGGGGGGGGEGGGEQQRQPQEQQSPPPQQPQQQQQQQQQQPGVSGGKGVALVEYMTESYERAAQYAHKSGLASQDAQLAALENWVGAMEAQARAASGGGGGGPVDAGVLAARALYVMELTRREPRWADWNDDEADHSLASPQATVAKLSAGPTQAVLESVKDSLTYATDAWLRLFTSLGGVGVLVDALAQHAAACRAQQAAAAAAAAAAPLGALGRGGGGSAASLPGGGGGAGTPGRPAPAAGLERPAAADALAAAQECVQALMAHAAGTEQLLSEHPRVLQLLCLSLTCQDQEDAKLPLRLLQQLLAAGSAAAATAAAAAAAADGGSDAAGSDRDAGGEGGVGGRQAGGAEKSETPAAGLDGQAVQLLLLLSLLGLELRLPAARPAALRCAPPPTASDAGSGGDASPSAAAAAHEEAAQLAEAAAAALAPPGPARGGASAVPALVGLLQCGEDEAPDVDLTSLVVDLLAAVVALSPPGDGGAHGELGPLLQLLCNRCGARARPGPRRRRPAAARARTQANRAAAAAVAAPTRFAGELVNALLIETVADLSEHELGDVGGRLRPLKDAVMNELGRDGPADTPEAWAAAWAAAVLALERQQALRAAAEQRARELEAARAQRKARRRQRRQRRERQLAQQLAGQPLELGPLEQQAPGEAPRPQEGGEEAAQDEEDGEGSSDTGSEGTESEAETEEEPVDEAAGDARAAAAAAAPVQPQQPAGAEPAAAAGEPAASLQQRALPAAAARQGAAAAAGAAAAGPGPAQPPPAPPLPSGAAAEGAAAQDAHAGAAAAAAAAAGPWPPLAAQRWSSSSSRSGGGGGGSRRHARGASGAAATAAAAAAAGAATGSAAATAAAPAAAGAATSSAAAAAAAAAATRAASGSAAAAAAAATAARAARAAAAASAAAAAGRAAAAAAASGRAAAAAAASGRAAAAAAASGRAAAAAAASGRAAAAAAASGRAAAAAAASGRAAAAAAAAGRAAAAAAASGRAAAAAAAPRWGRRRAAGAPARPLRTPRPPAPARARPRAGGPRPPPPPGGPRPPGYRPPYGAGFGSIHGTPQYGAAVAVPAPKRKTKSLFWDKIPDARLPGSLWEGFAAADWLDFDALEEAFQQVVRTKAADRGPSAAPKQVTLLDLKRCTAIGIRMARLKVPWPEVGAAILSLDGAALGSAEDVATVVQCLPTPDERTTLEAYAASGRPPEALSEAERFAMSLMARFAAAERAAEAAAVFQAHIAACKELRGSGTLRALLAATLAAGNFLNHGSRLGNAPGFRLKGLNKLHDSRSLDGKSTMLQALARQLLERGGDGVAVLAEELPHVASPKLKISWQEAADMLTAVEAAAASIAGELEQAEDGVKLVLTVQKPQPPGGDGGRSPARPGSAGGGRGPPARAGGGAGGAGSRAASPARGAGSDDGSAAPPAGAPAGAGDAAGASEAAAGGGEAGGEAGGCGAAPLVAVRIVVDNFQPVMAKVLSSIKGRQAELDLLRDRAASAWEGLLRHFGETRQSCPADTEFWADISLFVERFSAAQKAVLQEDRDAAERKQRLARAEAKKAAAEAAKKASALAASGSRKRLAGLSDAALQQQGSAGSGGGTPDHSGDGSAATPGGPLLGNGLMALAQQRVASSASQPPAGAGAGAASPVTPPGPRRPGPASPAAAAPPDGRQQQQQQQGSPAGFGSPVTPVGPGQQQQQQRAPPPPPPGLAGLPPKRLPLEDGPVKLGAAGAAAGLAHQPTFDAVQGVAAAAAAGGGGGVIDQQQQQQQQQRPGFAGFRPASSLPASPGGTPGGADSPASDTPSPVGSHAGAGAALASPRSAGSGLLPARRYQRSASLAAAAPPATRRPPPPARRRSVAPPAARRPAPGAAWAAAARRCAPRRRREAAAARGTTPRSPPR